MSRSFWQNLDSCLLQFSWIIYHLWIWDSSQGPETLWQICAHHHKFVLKIDVHFSFFCSHVLEHYICCRFRTFPRSYGYMDYKQAGTYIYSPPMVLQFCPQKLTPILDRPDITAQFLIPVNLVLLKITIIRNNCQTKENTQFDLFQKDQRKPGILVWRCFERFWI